ncbi:MAG: hypothetical protein RBT05_06980 [Bacteroidales bacterium]|jgi:hypothetical protein|nr:hypothetical protein [Bacteroidales bacterium]
MNKELTDLRIKTSPPFCINIWIAGNIEIIKQTCRKYCMDIGLCVTITPISYIYTGGQEEGVCIGLRNYPRFPCSEEELEDKAMALTTLLLVDACQFSAMLEGSTETIWITRRKEQKTC